MLICNKQTFDKMLYLIVLSQGNIGRLDEVLSAYRFMRSHLSNSIVAKMNSLRQTNTLSEMLIYLTMEKHKTESVCFVRAGRPPRTFFIPPSQHVPQAEGKIGDDDGGKPPSPTGGRGISKTHQPTGHSSPLRPPIRVGRKGRPQHKEYHRKGDEGMPCPGGRGPRKSGQASGEPA